MSRCVEQVLEPSPEGAFTVPFNGDLVDLHLSGGITAEIYVAGELVHVGTTVPFTLNLLKTSPHSVVLRVEKQAPSPMITAVFTLFDDLETRRRIALSSHTPYYVYNV